MYAVFTELLTPSGVIREILFTTDDRNYANEWAIEQNRNKKDPNLYYCVLPKVDIWFN